MQPAAPVPADALARPAAGPHWVLPLGLTTLAYLAAGFAALLLAIPPSYASPVFPAAGIALASVLVYGPRMLLAVAIGALTVTATVLAGRSAVPAQLAMLLSVAVALAATLQAALGAWLVRRFAGQPLVLTQPGDVARFFAACAASSVVACSVGTLALAAVGTVPIGGLAFTWGTWWVGALAGLLIGTPIALTLIGQPRSEWAPRRLTLGLTMTLVVVLLALGIHQVARWHAERVRATFDHDASSATFALATQLQAPMHALEALRGVFNVAPHVNRADMQTASEAWLRGGEVRAVGWAERVRRDDIAGFEARARADGMPRFRVVDRPPPAGRAGSAPAAAPAASPAGAGAPAADFSEAVAVRFLEPSRPDDPVLGVNVLSLAVSRATVLAAIDSGLPTVTAGLRPMRQDPGDPRIATVLYQAVYDSSAPAGSERRSTLRGLVFVSVPMDAQLAAIAGKVPAYLRLCIVDTGLGGVSSRLTGPPGCETGSPAYRHVRPILFAGRQWELRASAAPDELPDAADRSAWTFSAVGLLSAAMLGAALLITTGRTRRIESAVRERTAALRAEVLERQSAEQALRASERRFRNILDNVPIGVTYSDLSGRVIQANPRFCELTGYAEDELGRLGTGALSHPDDLAGEEALTAQLVGGQIPTYRNQRRIVTRGGGTVWVRNTVSLLRDARNEPSRIVAVVEDITEHLRLEEAESARETAEAANRAKSEFLSRMSHELRTPLNAMLGFAQLLEIDQRHPLTDAQRPWVAQIQQAGWHLLEMINDVLDLSRIESDNLRLQSATLDLREIVRATTALVAGDAERRGIRITEQLTPGTSAVVGDATRVKQILTNLLSNAVKYNVEGGRVHIAGRVAGTDQIEVSVTDTGLGMTAEQMDQLFRPFNRLGRERTSLPGTGIGLVISRRLAELMGGTIRVKSMPGEGTSFILRLPKAADPDTVRSSLDAFDALPTDYHQRDVHYIEDNETNVEVMRGILAQRSQVQLDVSVTGLDGLEAVRAKAPHLVLLDMHLPDISGLELLRHLKADPATASIPVIAVSADATAQQIDAALDAGAVRYLTKPVDVTELLAAVDDLLDRMDTGFS